MKQFYCLGIFIALTLVSGSICCGQDSAGLPSPEKYIRQVNYRTNQAAARIERKTNQTLDAFEKTQQRILKKWAVIDPESAGQMQKETAVRLSEIRSRMKRPSLLHASALDLDYFGYLDTLNGALHYLSQSKEDATQINSALSDLDDLKNQLACSREASQMIASQADLLARRLSSYPELLGRVDGIKKQYYYYNAQINEYKQLLADPRRAEQKALDALRKIPAFEKFIQDNSLFAGLFGLPADFNSSRSLEGLQTRSQVLAVRDLQVGNAPAAAQLISGRMEAARSQFDQYKKNFSQLGNAGEMPDFKPRELKTKRLFQRLEPGGNIQFQKTNQYFPATTDLAAQLAYRFHKNGSFGIGLSYKLGMGEGWQKIRFSHQGAGARSFLDWKIKGTFYASGGLELSRTTTFSNPAVLRQWSGWQKSALLGIDRQQKIGPKLKLHTMVLYDFLAARSPRSDRIKVRIGYTL